MKIVLFGMNGQLGWRRPATEDFLQLDLESGPLREVDDDEEAV